MQQYVTTNSSQRDVQEVENSVLRVFNSLYNNPLLNGPSLVKAQVFVANAPTTVFHKLGRQVNGYIVTNSNAPAIVYQSTTTNIAPTAQILLVSTVNATIDILFF